MEIFTIGVKCFKCGEIVTLKQSSNHSEYPPAGTCEKCGQFLYMEFSFKTGRHLVKGGMEIV